MRARFTERLTITLEPETLRKLEAISEEFGDSLSALIRECVNNDLPRLIDRKRKALKRKKP